jgi:hypothetical protein
MIDRLNDCPIDRLMSDIVATLSPAQQALLARLKAERASNENLTQDSDESADK